MPDAVSRARARQRRWTQVAPGETPVRGDPAQEPPATGPVDQEGRVAGTDFLPVGAVRRAPQDGRLHWSNSPGTRTYLVPVDLGGTTLEDGTYVLEAELEGAENPAVSRTLFATHWRNMPLSLYNAEVAIENLVFIEDRKTVKAMLRGRNDDKAHRIQSYWKGRDPTPETAFNELMAEYYGRVDDAAVRFRTDTVPGPDGLHTDQARIFIRNGPADASERIVLSSGGVQETWTYADGRRFVFWAASSLDPFELVDR
jgi:GWxTD domain-containing protein